LDKVSNLITGAPVHRASDDV